MKKLQLLVSLFFTLAVLAATPGTPDPNGHAVLNRLYSQLPDIRHCASGKLRHREILEAFKAVNRIRSLHNLPPVSYNCEWDKKSAKAALIVGANRNLTHHPSVASHCYSAEGAEASLHGNLFISIYSVWDPSLTGRRVPEIVTQMTKHLISTRRIISDWLIDLDVPSLGHRRWLLDPFLTEISFGRVDTLSHSGSRWDVVTGAALTYGSLKSIPPRSVNFFVACPFGNYPVELFDKNEFFSFSAIPVTANCFDNKFVRMNEAKITVKDPRGNSLPVQNVHQDNIPYGVPNILMWQTPGIRTGEQYRVIISNVRFGNTSRTYRYWFRIQP